MRRANVSRANPNSGCAASAMAVLEFNARTKKDLQKIKKHNHVHNNQVNIAVIPAAP
ncbi:MAG: hypothetical protein ACREQN_19605 [Candidatus Binataceae bacterium]